MKKIIILTSIISIFFACEQTITIDIEDNGRKIVINGILDADSMFIVSLSESKFILGSNQQGFAPVTGATVTLFENGTEVSTATGNQFGSYYSDFKTTAGNQYKIEVNSAKFGLSSAESRIPEPVEISNFRYEIGNFNNYGDSYGEGINIDLSFNDRNNQNNYYLIKVYNISQNISYDYDEHGNQIEKPYYYPKYHSLVSNDPSVFKADYNILGLLFEDNLFDGENHTIDFFVEYPFYGYYDSETNTQKYYIQLISLSEELYKYYLSYCVYSETEGNPFSEPVKVHSNIENGFGIFGGMSIATDSIEIEMPY